MYRNVGGLWAETGIATLTKMDAYETRTPVINFEDLPRFLGEQYILFKNKINFHKSNNQQIKSTTRTS